MMALCQRKRGNKIEIVGEREAASYDVGSKRRGSCRVATDLMENTGVSLP
jgi:hypothetical protein